MGGPDKSGLSFGTTYCLSATAACVAETSTFPFDITKTRMMLADNAGSTPKGMLGTGMGIVREEVGQLAAARFLPVHCPLELSAWPR